ncbi:hypothetical protein LOTGIDRAFT_162091 [Lottia gigantea]|uniref:J domain-containing protein n=1 Tax=Lottia gigantea TaxID=225164 RepID=V3ZNW3_LOTGI|nr:hypothetical protein LOTGIDRAFT_162091 [Lottia gigantea]ESO93068.1 hypothetical protein LOTGIDRAFT_162091 [Lottia gigantea]
MYQIVRLGKKALRPTLNSDLNIFCQHISTKYPDTVRNDSRMLSTSQRLSVEVRLQSDVDKAYNVLELDPNCDLVKVREKYVDLVKKYRKDKSLDTKKFTQVQEAYKYILESRRSEMIVEDSKVKDKDNNKKDRDEWREAVEQEYRLQKLALQSDTDIIRQDRRLSNRSTNMSSGCIERMVEDMVQQSMRNGDFDNLIGSGKPIDYDNRNPLVDTSTYNLNKILINNGFTPEWITLHAEIRRDIALARQKTAVLQYKIMKDNIGHCLWEKQVEEFSKNIREINRLVEKYNNDVPFLEKQLAPFRPERELEKTIEKLENYLPEDSAERDKLYEMYFVPSQPKHYTQYDDVNLHWRDVWKDIKSFF